MPAIMRRAHVVLVHETLAQAVHVEVAEAGHEVQDGEVVLRVARPHGVHGDGHVHVPQLRPHVLDHLDAVAGVEAPALELEGRALEVLVLQLLVELEAAQRHDDGLASLHGLLLVADHGVGAHDLLGLGVLDEALVMAVEQHLHAQSLTLGVQLVEGQHAEAVDRGQLAGALVGVVVQEEVLGDGTGQRLLHHLVGHTVLVGILGVADALLNPGLDHRIGCLALGEGADVVLEALLVGLFHNSPLAVVDGAVSAAALGGLLKHEHLLAALVGADERRPHARAAVADDEQIALVVPGLGQPVTGVGEGVGTARAFIRAAGQRRRARHGRCGQARALQKRATGHAELFVFLHERSFLLMSCGCPRAPREASRSLRFRAFVRAFANLEGSKRTLSKAARSLGGPLPLRLSSAFTSPKITQNRSPAHLSIRRIFKKNLS